MRSLTCHDPCFSQGKWTTKSSCVLLRLPILRRYEEEERVSRQEKSCRMWQTRKEKMQLLNMLGEAGSGMALAPVQRTSFPLAISLPIPTLRLLQLTRRLFFPRHNTWITTYSALHLVYSILYAGFIDIPSSIFYSHVSVYVSSLSLRSYISCSVTSIYGPTGAYHQHSRNQTRR